MANVDIKAMAERFEGDKHKLFEELAQAAKDDFVKNFEGQSFDGKPWPEGGKDYHGLDNTGELKSAVENPNIQVDDKGFKLTIENDYGAYQNYGTDKIPKRQFLGKSKELSDKMKEIIKDNILKTFKR